MIMSARKRATVARGADATAVILEDIRAQNRVVLEAVQSMGESLRSEIAALRQELCERIERLEAVVRQNSIDIRKNSEDIRKNSEDIQRLEAELRSVKVAVLMKVDAAALAALELRVSALERRLG